jgi:hypothetical protein
MKSPKAPTFSVYKRLYMVLTVSVFVFCAGEYKRFTNCLYKV